MRFREAFSKNGESRKPKAETFGSYKTRMMIQFYENLLKEGRISKDGSASYRLEQLRERYKLIRRQKLGFA